MADTPKPKVLALLVCFCWMANNSGYSFSCHDAIHNGYGISCVNMIVNDQTGCDPVVRCRRKSSIFQTYWKNVWFN